MSNPYEMAQHLLTAHVRKAHPVSTEWPYHRETANAARANRALGHHWWSRETMKAHGSRVHQMDEHGIMVTSENDDGARCYNVRIALPWGDVATIGEYREHRTLASAQDAAVRARHALVTTDTRTITQQGTLYRVDAHRLGLPGQEGVVRVMATHLQSPEGGPARALIVRQALAAARRVTQPGEHLTRQRQPMQPGSGLAGVYRVWPTD